MPQRDKNHLTENESVEMKRKCFLYRPDSHSPVFHCNFGLLSVGI